MRDLSIKEVAMVVGPVVVCITAVILALIFTGNSSAALEFSSGVAVLFGLFAYMMFFN